MHFIRTHPEIKNHTLFDEQGKEIQLYTLIEMVEKETAQAYGGCTNCYGKGYSTVEEFIEGGHGNSYRRTKLNPYRPCEKCDRGKQIRELIHHIKFI